VQLYARPNSLLECIISKKDESGVVRERRARRRTNTAQILGKALNIPGPFWGSLHLPQVIAIRGYIPHLITRIIALLRVTLFVCSQARSERACGVTPADMLLEMRLPMRGLHGYEMHAGECTLMFCSLEDAKEQRNVRSTSSLNSTGSCFSNRFSTGARDIQT
jgi:hypothetical protein